MTNLTAIITAHGPQCLAGWYSLLVRQIPMRRLGLALLVLFVMSAASVAMAQEPPALDGSDGRDLVLRLFRPQPAVKTPVTTIQRARFPVVDIHAHFRVRTRQSPEARDAYVELMDRNGIAISVSMDGGWGDEFQEHAKHLWEKHRERFVIFANVNWRGSGKENEPATWDCQRPEFGRVAAEKLAEARRQGASGLKLFKDFGLSYRNPDGSFIKVDDPRFDPIWEACGKLGMPVLMHTADPSAFFAPIDAKNERWEELHRRPEWSFHGKDFPSREELLAARNRVVARHPKTTFIAAHMANDAEDLATLAQWLDQYPNLYVEIASRISELGRQPYSARRFLIRYSDRVLFGTDGPWPETRVRLYWRFLETQDENFPYSEKEFPPQGFWNIYGVDLPDEVLKKLYHENAARLIPGVKERLKKG
ncbi:MAG: amidohydrolase family protein [Pirellulales bacterium]